MIVPSMSKSGDDRMLALPDLTVGVSAFASGQLAEALRHRRGVHVLQVVLPVDHRGVERELALDPPA